MFLDTKYKETAKVKHLLNGQHAKSVHYLQKKCAFICILTTCISTFCDPNTQMTFYLVDAHGHAFRKIPLNVLQEDIGRCARDLLDLQLPHVRPDLILYTVLLEDVGGLQHCELLDVCGKRYSEKQRHFTTLVQPYERLYRKNSSVEHSIKKIKKLKNSSAVTSSYFPDTLISSAFAAVMT